MHELSSGCKYEAHFSVLSLWVKSARLQNSFKSLGQALLISGPMGQIPPLGLRPPCVHGGFGGWCLKVFPVLTVQDSGVRKRILGLWQKTLNEHLCYLNGAAPKSPTWGHFLR